MTKTVNSSVYDVSQRTVRISARVTLRTDGAKPSHVSWGDFIERLLKNQGGRGLYDNEVKDYAAWCIVRLDRVSAETLRRMPADPVRPFEDQADRLMALSDLTREIAAMRSVLEKVLYAS
jgi:hypothetical protein